MKERQIEQKLVKAAIAQKGVAMKFISPGCIGVPDRIVLLPGGMLGFVEIKAPGKKPRPVQARRIEQLKRLGFKVYVLDSAEQIPRILDEIGGILDAIQSS